MDILDLGRLKGPILAFGGPYSNLQALEAVLSQADELAIPAENRICTGDAAAYCADPAAVCDRLMSEGMAVVKGNCEAQLAEGSFDCNCGFTPGSTCSILAVAWFAFATGMVRTDHRVWMARCPDRIVFEHAGLRVAVLHGGASAVNAFLWPVSDDAAFAREIALLQEQVGPVDRIIAGHAGVAFQRSVAGVQWINAGAIGLPENDGSPATRFALIDADGTVRLKKLYYDHFAAARAMEAVGLTQGYDRALVTGFWPSEDVLPKSLRRAA